MAGRFSRLRRSPADDESAPTEAMDAVPAGEATDAASEDPATAPTVAEPAPAGVETDHEDGSAATEQPEAETVAVVSGDGTAVTETDAGGDPEPEGPPGFIARGRLRRRLRYVRRAREIALRDLGGLVFDLHRFGRERGDLVEQKLAGLTALDGEMRALEAALDDRREVTVLREPGLAGCPRCGALCASDASYCSSCGLPLERGASLPAGPTPAGSGDAGTPPALPAPDQPTTPVP